MSRTPLVSRALWTSVAALSLAAGCADDEPVFIDAPVAQIDAAVPADASLAVAAFPASVTGAAACGVAVPDTVDVSVMNTGTQPLVIASATATGGFTVTTLTPITIAPGESAALAVRPPASVIGTDIGGSTKSGVLSFVTNETGAPTRTVDLDATVDGAQLSMVDGSGAALTEVMFSSQSTCPSFQNVFVRNSGNRPAELGFPSASGFAFSGFSPSSTAGPGEDVNQVMYVYTLGPCTGTATVTYQATGTICNELPVTLAATFSIGGQSSCFCS